MFTYENYSFFGSLKMPPQIMISLLLIATHPNLIILEGMMIVNSVHISSMMSNCSIEP